MKRMLVLAILVAVTGCSSKPKDQSTPQDLLKKWHAGLLKADKIAVMDCVFPRTSEYRNMAWYSCEYMKAAKEFRKKLEARFEAGAWDKLWNIPGTLRPEVLPDNPTWDIDIEGDKGEVVIYPDNPPNRAPERFRRLQKVGTDWNFRNYDGEAPWTCWWVQPSLLGTMNAKKPWTCWWLNPKLLPTMADSHSDRMLVLVTKSWRIWDCWWVYPSMLGNSQRPERKAAQASFGPVSGSASVGAWYSIDSKQTTTEVVLCPERQKEKLIKSGGVWYFDQAGVNDPIAVSERYAKAKEMFAKAQKYMDENPDASMEQVRSQFDDLKKDRVTIIMPSAAPVARLQ